VQKEGGVYDPFAVNFNNMNTTKSTEVGDVGDDIYDPTQMVSYDPLVEA